MNREEFIGKLEMVYVGDRNAFNEIVDVYDELKGDNKHLNDLLDGALKEYDRLNNIINKLEEYCWELKAIGCREGALDMLDKIEELKNGDNK